MTVPNFFVIGAPRCGTSSLYSALAQHPDVYMSPTKEPWYFSIGTMETEFAGPKDYYYHRLNRAEYDALFSARGQEKIVGEASTDYLYSDAALDALRREFPTAKLLAILRNPAERAYSNFVQHVSQAREGCSSLREAIALEEERRRLNWSHYWFYRDMGFYGRQLERYYRYFAKDQLCVIIFEDFQAEPNRVYREVFEFLEIDSEFVPAVSEKERNAGRIPSNSFLQGVLTKPSVFRAAARAILPHSLSARILKVLLAKRNLASPEPMSVEEKRELLLVYEDDIRLLESLTGHDLSRWRESGQREDMLGELRVSETCQRPDIESQ